MHQFRSDGASVLCASIYSMKLGRNLDVANLVIQRLNDSFDGDWSFEVMEYQQAASLSDIVTRCRDLILNIHLYGRHY